MIVYYISAFTGAITILMSLVLIYKKRITLAQVSSNPNIKEEAIKAEIFNILKISTNYPAIALFIIGLLLIVLPIFTLPTEVYTVTGTVEKEDGKPPRDISIMTRFPPLFPSSRGEIRGLTVWKGPGGRLPTLSFVHPDYAVEAIDLNNAKTVEIKRKEIKINNNVKLLPLQ